MMKIVQPNHMLFEPERSHCDILMRKIRVLYRTGELLKKEFDEAVGVSKTCSMRWFSDGALPGKRHYDQVVSFAKQRLGEDYVELNTQKESQWKT